MLVGEEVSIYELHGVVVVSAGSFANRLFGVLIVQIKLHTVCPAGMAIDLPIEIETDGLLHYIYTFNLYVTIC